MRSPAFWWEKPGVAAALLAPLAWIYASVAARRLARPGDRVGVPVICVGNPTVGGAGKTPAAIAIARLLIAAGERPMFLSRGYGGRLGGDRLGGDRLGGPVMVEAAHSAADVGDEPLLLARIAPAVVARDRLAGARLAIRNGASVLVMDDGFQNPSLTKDFSVLMIDGARGIGNGHVIPAGPLRAPLAPQLARASALMFVGASADSTPLEHAAGVARFDAALEPDSATVKSLAGKKVLAFAGIGNPEKFFATLAAAGIEAPIRRGFADHHRYTAGEAAALVAEAKANNLQLLTTEKDLARLDASLGPLASQAQALPVELKVRQADEFKQALLAACRVKPA